MKPKFDKEIVTAYVVTAMYYYNIGKSLDSLYFFGQALMINKLRETNILERN